MVDNHFKRYPAELSQKVTIIVKQNANIDCTCHITPMKLPVVNKKRLLFVTQIQESRPNDHRTGKKSNSF